MNLQLFYFSNTTACEGLRQANIFLTTVTPITKANFSTIVLPIKALLEEALPNELHLLETQKQVRDHLWYLRMLILQYYNCCQANWARKSMHMSVDVFYIQKINIYTHNVTCDKNISNIN